MRDLLESNETPQPTMTLGDLLDFSEAASLLDVSAEKVRRFVVEDRAIRCIRISLDGTHNTVDLDSLSEGGFRIGEHGNISIGLPVYERRARVGTRFEPCVEMGELRIERTELDRFRNALQTQSDAVQSSSIEAATTPTVAVGPSSRAGLDPAEIAAAFTGCWGSETAWTDRLKKLSTSSWMNTPPVLLQRGRQGKGPDGKPVPTRRDPIELARGLLKRQHSDLQTLSRRFRVSPELGQWKADWTEFAGWGR